jgi:hypothetical protein
LPLVFTPAKRVSAAVKIDWRSTGEERFRASFVL